MRLNRKKTIYLQMEIVSIPYRLTLDTEVPDPFVSHQI